VQPNAPDLAFCRDINVWAWTGTDDATGLRLVEFSCTDYEFCLRIAFKCSCINLAFRENDETNEYWYYSSLAQLCELLSGLDTEGPERRLSDTIMRKCEDIVEGFGAQFIITKIICPWQLILSFRSNGETDRTTKGQQARQDLPELGHRPSPDRANHFGSDEQLSLGPVGRCHLRLRLQQNEGAG